MELKQHNRKNLLRYIAAFFLFLAVGYLLLLLAGLVPQQAVLKNVIASVEQLESEGLGARILDNSSNVYQLDTWTDARILLQALYMNTAEDPSQVLMNAYWDDPNGMKGNALDSLIAIAETGTAPSPNTTYVRYCMGFRIFVRPLLAIGSYALLRQVIAWTMTVLFLFVAIGFSKRLGMAEALLFAVSYLSLNPILLMSSPQYCSCIFVAFAGMLALLFFPAAQKNMGMVMFLIGMATQFFDFYTYPLLTAIFPLGTYLLLEQRASRCLSVKEMLTACGKGLALWGIAYVGVWVFKLGLIELLTQEGAFSSARSAVSAWVGPAATEAIRYDSKWDVLYHCIRTYLVKMPINLIVLVLLAVLWGGSIAFAKGYRKAFLLQSVCWGLLALLPMLWLYVTARAVDIHMFFQYRTLGGTFFAAGCAAVSVWAAKHRQASSPSEADRG